MVKSLLTPERHQALKDYYDAQGLNLTALLDAMGQYHLETEVVSGQGYSAEDWARILDMAREIYKCRRRRKRS